MRTEEFTMQFWSVWTIVCTDLLAYLCVLRNLTKGSLLLPPTQLNLSGSLSIHGQQGLAGIQYLGGGQRWSGWQTSSATSHSKLYTSGFLSFNYHLCVTSLTLSLTQMRENPYSQGEEGLGTLVDILGI